MSTSPIEANPEDWQKLDPKTLLISPIKTLRQIMVPAAAALIGIGTQQPRWLLLATPAIIVVLLVASALPWLTTRYHVLEGQLVVKRGLLNKRRLTAPLDRVRTVDLEATLMHRLLGLQRVQVGTGVDGSRIELDALGSGQAAELRHFLLARSEVAAPAAPAVPSTGEAGSVLDDQPLGSAASQVSRAHELARLDYGWVRYAPLSLARLAIVAVTIGALSQFADDIPIFNADTGNTILDWITEHSLWLLVPLVLLGFLVAWVIIATLGYVAQWWDMRLVVENENLHLTRGLFTTNSTTMEMARIRGINLNEPILMRWASGADLSVLATGTSDGTPAVLPPCPVDVAGRVGSEILGSAEPLAVPLHPHGPAARRRCHVRHQWSTILIALALVPLLI
ncbi:MAG: PH domain-containing protein, partial [Nocardioides sp.]|nr:PH domain-containing protein [Nocardioides sp.]